MYNPKFVNWIETNNPVGLAFQMPIALPTGQGGSFLGEEGFSYIPTGVLEISNAPIRSKNIRFGLVFLVRIMFDQVVIFWKELIPNIPIGNEIIFGGGLGLKPFPFRNLWEK